MNMYRISFTRVEDDAELSLDLISHYTCIYGRDSGEGKTEFISLVEEGMNDGSIRIDSPLPFAIGSPGNIEALLLNENRQIIMIDESVVLRDELIRKINGSTHLFICISRAMPLKNSYPLDGIYLLSRTENGWFAVEHDDSFVRMIGDEDIQFDRIITEARENRSEHEFLSAYLQNIEPAGGHDRIEKLLRKDTRSALIFTDLGNIGSAYGLLRKRVTQNPEIRFYDYQAFEQLLTDSPLVMREGKDITLDIYDYVSIERYYEELLEKMTEGTPMEYHHGAHLPKIFFDSVLEEIMDSDVGRALLEYIRKVHD